MPFIEVHLAVIKEKRAECPRSGWVVTASGLALLVPDLTI